MGLSVYARAWRAGIIACGLAWFGPGDLLAETQQPFAPAELIQPSAEPFGLAASSLSSGGLHDKWIGVQRRPEPGSREALEAALGATVHDFSAANDDLEDMLALMALVDDYAGPSNANTHLRAGVGGAQLVFVPDPPEWRWMASGDRSPWFPAMRLVRS